MTELLYYTKPDGSVVVFKEGDRLLLSGEEYAVSGRYSGTACWYQEVW